MDERTSTNLKDLNVVITGAARSLGAALALGLSDLGCNVILCARSREALDVIAGQMEARTGRRPEKFVIDLADAASVEATAQAISARVPVVDILINNGTAWLGSRETPYEAAEVMAVINSAITGTFLFTQALIPALHRSARPDVVTIGSISGLLNVSTYTASVPFYAAKRGQAEPTPGGGQTARCQRSGLA